MAHDKALPRMVAPAGLAETTATAAPAAHQEVQAVTPGPTARLPLSANARSPISVPTQAAGSEPPAASAPVAPAAAVPGAPSAPAVPVPAAPAPAAPLAAATYVTTTGGCQWRTLAQPYQYQARGKFNQALRNGSASEPSTTNMPLAVLVVAFDKAASTSP